MNTRLSSSAAKALWAPFLLMASLVMTSFAYGNDRTADLTGDQFSKQKFIDALTISTRWASFEANCGPHIEELASLAREPGFVPTNASEVVALEPMKSASVTINFGLNSAVLTTDARERLDEVASALQEPHMVAQCFQLAGHTCDLGSNALNFNLSKSRAEAVRAYLIDKGVAQDRLLIAGFGETSPMLPNESSANRERNRRVDFGALAPAAKK